MSLYFTYVPLPLIMEPCVGGVTMIASWLTETDTVLDGDEVEPRVSVTVA